MAAKGRYQYGRYTGVEEGAEPGAKHLVCRAYKTEDGEQEY